MPAITVELPSSTQARLRLLAERRGETLEVYIRNLAEREADTADIVAQGIEWLRNRTPAEVQAARERIFAASSAPRELPPGETILEVVVGKWPGTETDAEVQAALEKLS